MLTMKFLKQDSEVLIAINSQGLYVIDPVNVVSHHCHCHCDFHHSNDGDINEMVFCLSMTDGKDSTFCVLDSPLTTHQVVLLGLKFEELSWDYAKPSQENNEDCLPCLFIQFCVIENGRRVSKILQVFYSDIILMDCVYLNFLRCSHGRLFRWMP